MEYLPSEEDLSKTVKQYGGMMRMAEVDARNLSWHTNSGGPFRV